eukprot:m51a1_g9586 hypothetical protein (117) ;mRNA; f:1005266-1005694
MMHTTTSITTAATKASRSLDHKAPEGSAGVVCMTGEVGVTTRSVLPALDSAGLWERNLDAVLAQMGRIARLRAELQAVNYTLLSVSQRTMGLTTFVKHNIIGVLCPGAQLRPRLKK